LKPFDLVTVDKIEDALRILSENIPDAVPIAGGTDLLVRMKKSMVRPRLLVDISKIPELNGIEMIDEGLLIGSMVTHAQIAASDLIRNHAPAVAASSSSVGSAQTRQLGTIGGNLVSCVPSLDSAPPLLVLDAMVTVSDIDGRRRIPIETFFVAPRCSFLTPKELLVNILIPREELGKASSFQKIGRRKALSLSLVNAAACVEIDKESRSFNRTRLALGAVAPTPIRARMAEAYLNGKDVGPAAIEEAGRIAAGEASPIDDFRSSAQYRRELIKVLTRRVIRDALSLEIAL
jgi:CO/xanthine dehydrogenase FAD-binding subunit